MRGMDNFIKRTCKKNLICCEVGVMKGDHASELLDNLKIQRLYLVDPYLPYIDYDDYIKKNIIMDKKIANNNLSKYKSIEFIYRSSKRASKLFVDGMLDFVYIDANHSYKHVLRDINCWYPKVKYGGVIGGHDFNTQHNDVILAVLDFIDNNDLKLSGFDDEDWWMKIDNKN